MEGWLTKGEQSKFMEKLKPLSATTAEEHLSAQRSVRDSQRAAQRLRVGLPNQARFATMAMLDANLEFELRLIHFVTEPSRELYSVWNTGLRSVASAKEHHLSFVRGENPFFDALRAVFCPFSKQAELMQLGFEMVFDGTAFKSMGGDHIMMLEQAEKTRRMWKLVLCQCYAFIKGFANMWCGYPGKFAHLLSNDAQHRETHWAECVRDWLGDLSRCVARHVARHEQAIPNELDRGVGDVSRIACAGAALDARHCRQRAPHLRLPWDGAQHRDCLPEDHRRHERCAEWADIERDRLAPAHQDRDVVEGVPLRRGCFR